MSYSKNCLKLAKADITPASAVWCTGGIIACFCKKAGSVPNP